MPNTKNYPVNPSQNPPGHEKDWTTKTPLPGSTSIPSKTGKTSPTKKG
jgi:hypothetical protein